MTRSFLKITVLSATLLSATLGANVALAACPSGTVACGANYCMAVGRVCCAGVGRPDLSCPSGSSCSADGSCSTSGSSGGSSSGGSSSGGGTCPSGTVECGGKCIPAGATCCTSAGYPGKYCPSGTRCNTDGTCGGGSPGSAYSSSGASTGGDHGIRQCAPAYVGTGCTSVKACCETFGGAETCWYEADGKRFDCNGACTQADAAEVVDYCDGGPRVTPGCQAAPAPTGSDLGLSVAGLAAIGLAGLALVRRARGQAGSK